MLITASVEAAIRGTNWSKIAGSGVGCPSAGLRACRCKIAAPASAASIDCSVIWSGVSGRYGDMVGVCMAPVTAHVMMTLSCVLAIAALQRSVRRKGSSIKPAGRRHFLSLRRGRRLGLDQSDRDTADNRGRRNGEEVLH